MTSRQKVLVIVGPTSSGKSALAVALARKFSGEVVSADSRQVYRGLNIGTGKITKLEMKGVRHHLLDVALPRHTFSAHDFVKHAQRAIDSIAKRHKLPILCGGTGFYLDVLLGRITLPDVEPDFKLRAQLEKKSSSQLFALLKKNDPKRAAMLSSSSERNNKIRLVRALEVATHFNKSTARPGLAVTYQPLWVGIAPPFPVLEKKIYARLTTRLKQGMVAEAKRLHKNGLSYKRMEALGLEYRFLSYVLQGKITIPQMESELRRAIRKYAKRQLTYWKRNRDIEWFPSTKMDPIAQKVRAWQKSIPLR